MGAVIFLLSLLSVRIFFSSLPDGVKVVAERQEYIIPILLLANLLDWDSTCRGCKKFGVKYESSWLLRKSMEIYGIGWQFAAIKLGLISAVLAIFSLSIPADMRLVMALFLVLASISNYLSIWCLPSSESPTSESPSR